MQYVIADEEPHTAMVLTSLLSSQLKVSATNIQAAYDSEQLFESVANLAGDSAIIVLNIAMPEAFERLTMLKAVLRRHDDIRVVMHSTNSNPFLVEDSISAGALGYVLKRSSLLMLAEAIIAARKHRVLIDPAIDMASIAEHPWSKLTKQERRVLIALCKGVSQEDIASDLELRYDTISRHKRNAMSRLGIRKDIEVLSYLYRNGLTYLLDD